MTALVAGRGAAAAAVAEQQLRVVTGFARSFILKRDEDSEGPAGERTRRHALDRCGGALHASRGRPDACADGVRAHAAPCRDK